MAKLTDIGFSEFTEEWFLKHYPFATDTQLAGWTEIRKGENTLIAAPTGSGKTMAAFLSCMDVLIQDDLNGTLLDGVKVIYISPLKALSNDIKRNLEDPLEELSQLAIDKGMAPLSVRAAVRTGDTSPSDRQKTLRKPPHILVTTPETLYIMLTSEKTRQILKTTETVIVDEIHALARDKRGSHMSLTLERLDQLCNKKPVRIGLSATQKPIEEIAQFLVGNNQPCAIVNAGHVRDLDLAIKVPQTELQTICSHETWGEIYEILAQQIREHRSSIIFVNTRNMAERVGHILQDILGEDAVASHHGSLSKDIRLKAEQRLKDGELKAIVATASLELGIDIGYIDLVCQIGSPRSIATFLQRVGRSGHALGKTPKGHLYPLTRDELLECMALMRSVKTHDLDRVIIPEAPLDILAQQIVAEIASSSDTEGIHEDYFYNLFIQAYPFRDLKREDYDKIIEMLSRGVDPRSKRGAWIYRDLMTHTLKPRRGARLVAITCGGTIPENAEYRVLLEDDGSFIGTVNEDFAIESQRGDIFLLGNNSWRIRQVRTIGEVIVQDAQGAPATVPFWFGEGLGRTDELSVSLGDLRQDIANKVIHSEIYNGYKLEGTELKLTEGLLENTASPLSYSEDELLTFLKDDCASDAWAAKQALTYVAAQVAAVGCVPTTRRVIFERFFDETGGMQLVIHAPFGARVNRAWGLSLRKRFCRSFNFELQASADDNGIVLSLGMQHSFNIEDVFSMVNTANLESLLTQAMLAVPVFQIRWRWNSTRALAVMRFRGGKKVPPPLQRFNADDLLSAIFPESTACLEHISGDIELPDHPLVDQTVHDCLTENMDLGKLTSILNDFKEGRIEFVARDTREPSPFSHALLNANPYAFLDDAPLEERRARAVATRRTLTAEQADDLGRLDPEAIATVRDEAKPTIRDADELHDLMLSLKVFPEDDAKDCMVYLDDLIARDRIAIYSIPGKQRLYVAAECQAFVKPILKGGEWDRDFEIDMLDYFKGQTASVEIIRGRLDVTGPLTMTLLKEQTGLDETLIKSALEALEGEGYVLRGHFSSSSFQDANGPEKTSGELEWCERRLLARIHRLTIKGLRALIQPVSPHDYIKFLLRWQGVDRASKPDGVNAVLQVVQQLEGLEISASAWEADIFPNRIQNYGPGLIDELCLYGQVLWSRLSGASKEDVSNFAMNRAVPVSFILREDLEWIVGETEKRDYQFSPHAQDGYDILKEKGAMFIEDIRSTSDILPSQVEDGLSQLAAAGMINADGFDAIRTLVDPTRKKQDKSKRRRQRAKHIAYKRGGRWSVFPPFEIEIESKQYLTDWAWQLMDRYGVVFRDLLSKEQNAPPWYQLIRIYRRLEARGEIRGGRFISSVGGEQFALPDMIEKLRGCRDDKARNFVFISATDPCNLIGVISKDIRVPASSKNNLCIKNGRLAATKVGDEINYYIELSIEEKDYIRRHLTMNALARQRQNDLQVEIPGLH